MGATGLRMVRSPPMGLGGLRSSGAGLTISGIEGVDVGIGEAAWGGPMGVGLEPSIVQIVHFEITIFHKL